MAHAPGEPIKPSDYDHIELSCSGVLHEPVQCRARVLRAGNTDVHVFARHHETTMLGVFAQSDQLRLRVLPIVLGAAAGVTSHPASVVGVHQRTSASLP